MLRSFFARLPEPVPLRRAIPAAIAAGVCIAALAGLTVWTETPLLMAPFGSSALLIFATPGLRVSQPAVVVGGHFVATALSLVLRLFLPDAWWSLGIAVAIVIGVLAATRLLHPPAGADPLLVLTENPDLSFIFVPVLLGSVLLVVAGSVFHRAMGTHYPLLPRPPVEPG